MDIIQAIIIGIVEGFTEFLPISSTGHMIVVNDFLGIKQSELIVAYEIIIQFAAILAVMIAYKEKLTFKEFNLWKNVFVAFLPLLIVGYLFKDEIKSLFSVEIVAWMFIIGGIIFLIVEKFYKEDETHTLTLDDVTLIQSFWIGIAQLFSFIPGTSRAGATIIGGMLLKLDRKTSAEFSFLLAIPVVGAVSAYDLLKHYESFALVDWMPFLVGFVVAFIVAFVTIRLFLVFLQRFTFVVFGWYRIVLGVLLLLLWVY
jgi:undecaprenyl-diphosphatase